MTHTDPLNVALLGYGFAGKTFHAPLIDSAAGLRLAVVVSSDAEKVRKDVPGVTVFGSPDAAFANPEIDLIVVATPNRTHFDLAQRALQAGKHVVVDKPFTIYSSEAQQLIDLAKKQERVLSVFQSRRWDADFLTLRGLMADDQLGEVMYFESRYDRFRVEVRQRWRELAGPGSGIWYDLGSHLLDQALQLFGFPEAIFADLGMQREGATATDYFHVLLRYSRRRVILHGSMLVPAVTARFSVHGLRASYIKYGMDAQEQQLKAGVRPGDPHWGSDPQDGTLITPRGESVESRTVPTTPGNYLAFYTELRDAIRAGSPNPVPPEQALAVIAALELGVESSEAKREVKFSLSSA
jgi:predicted dehydrogenase